MPTDFFAELHHAVRFLRRRPLSSVATVATLAAAIAVATTAFGLARAILWRPLPFDQPAALVFVWEDVERDGRAQASRVTGATFGRWRQAPGVFSGLALFGATGFSVDLGDGVTSIRGVRVSANYFDTLGARAALGRTFVPGDDEPGAGRVVILSHAFWRERLGGRPDAIGTALRLSGESYTIVGVMPAQVFPAWPVNPATVTLEAESREVWVTIPRTAALAENNRAHVFGVVGRLASSVTPAQAAERLRATAVAGAPDPHGARVEPLREQFVRDARPPLLLAAGAALAVLLIACANLAALFVSAFESRRTELAVRVAVGASVSRLARRLALEAAILSAAGGVAGLFLAQLALAVLPSRLPASIPLLTVPSVDVTVAACAAILGLFAAVLFTAWPVIRLVIAPPMPRGTAAPAGLTVYRVLVATQVSLTVALAVAAGLLAQSLYALERQAPGFTTDGVLVADIALPGTNASPSETAEMERRLLSAVAALPQVQGVAAAYDHPLEANWSEAPTVVGADAAQDAPRQAELRIVSPEYLATLDVALLDGRSFTADDTIERPGVALVNEAFVRELGGRALGRRLRTGTPRGMLGDTAPNEFEITGVVANERFRGVERPAQAAFYLSTRQFPQSGTSLLVRTARAPMVIAPDVRAALRAFDDRITFSRPRALDAIMAEQLASRRVTTDVIGGFTTAALALAGLGMYALLSVLVGRRAREIGVRLAIGASPESVAREILRDSARTAIFGLLPGCGLALLAGRLVGSLLVGVSPHDPVTLVAVAGALLLLAVAAAVVPARRAARIDPVTLLRAE